MKNIFRLATAFCNREIKYKSLKGIFYLTICFLFGNMILCIINNVVVEVCEMQILKNEEVSEEIYLKTWELDNKTFKDEDKIEKQKALEWFYASNKSIIVAYDEIKRDVMGYIFYFILKPSFSAGYINTNKSFQKISAKDFKLNSDNRGDLYIFSTVVKEEYRDVKFKEDPIFKTLNNEFLKEILRILKSQIKINYVYAESVSKDGEKYLESLNMKPCFYFETDCKYVRKFDLEMFEKCSNYKQVLREYKKELSNKKIEKPDLSNHEYLHVKDNVLYYKGTNLYELAKRYDSPLEVGYLDMIPTKIETIKTLFNQSISRHNYLGTYNYAYATKANYYCEVVATACKNIKFLETSSAYDINIIIRLAELNLIDSTYTIVCNGFKNEKYIDKIVQLLQMNINVIPIIENYTELEMLINSEVEMQVGIRYNSDFDSKLIKNNFKDEDEFSNRFGFEEKDVYDVAKKVAQSKNLTLKVFHFHFGGTISDINNYIKGYSNIFRIYCALKKKYKELKYFDFGGGLPVKYSLNFSFDYEKLIDNIVKKSKEIADFEQIPHPDLIGEHGRYTVADHSIYIYKVDFSKQAEHVWYILNTSIMNMTPDAWAIDQEFTILPVNNWNKKFQSVLIGGETCDPDDRYYLNNKNIEVSMPAIAKGDELYIAILSVGAYQESISGVGGVHHCMIPEGEEVIINREGKRELKINSVQTKEEMLEILGYNDNRILDMLK